MAMGRPGRPPKYRYDGNADARVISIRLPKRAIERLDRWVKGGVYASRSEAIYHRIVEADDAILRKLTKLKEQLDEMREELKLKDQKLARLERERDEALEKAREWEEKYRELEARLASLASGVVEDSKEVGEMKAEDLISELERVDLVELAREYYQLREALHKWDGYVVFVGEERFARKDVEARVNALRERINQVLDLRGIPRAEAWKRINKGKFEGLDKLAKG